MHLTEQHVIYDSKGNLVSLTDADGRKTTYTYDLEGNLTVYDGRGSVSQVVNADNIVEAYTYDPFGNVTDGAPDFESFYGYNAEETNPVTGLQYLRARYYDSATGRFSTADSYLGDVTNPLTLNRYIYTLNNPVMYNDSSGHFVGTALLIAAAVAAGVGIAVGLSGCANTKKDVIDDSIVNLPTEENDDNIIETPKDTSFNNVREFIPHNPSKKLSKLERMNLVNNAIERMEEKIDKVNSIDIEIKDYIRGTNQAEEGKTIEEIIEELNTERVQLCEQIEAYCKIVTDMGDDNVKIPELPILGESPYKYSKKYNTAKEFAEAYRDKIQPYAEQHGYDMDFLLSVLFVESNGAGYNEEGLLRIRFENHIFFDYLTDDKVSEAEKYFNDNNDSKYHELTRGDGQTVHLHDNDQNLEYEAFEIAKSIDENAAYMAISMGMGQVMGFNHKTLGYDSPKEMYETFSKDSDYHIQGVISYMNSIPELKTAIANKDAENVAKYYNGEQYEKIIKYSNSINQAYSNITGE